MKRKFLGIVGAVMLILFSQCAAFAIVYGKSGYEREGYSEETAWEIDSAAVLVQVRDDVNAGKLDYEAYYKLTKDIDLTDYREWTPIGAKACSAFDEPRYVTNFKGHFNGNGHTIKVNISRLITDSKSYVEIYHGLFGIILGGSIKNLKVTGNVSIYTRAYTAPSHVGGIAAFLVEGSIENCTFNGKVTTAIQGSNGNDCYAGGIVGRAGYSFYIFSIKNCKAGNYSDTAISASTNTLWKSCSGGIAGYLDDHTFRGSSCEVSGNYSRVKLSGTNTGGIYGIRNRDTGIFTNNIEADPSDPPPDSATLTIKTTSLPNGTVGTSYSTQLKASGATPITWSATGLPDGLSCSKAGKISGKPTEAGSFKVKVKAKNSAKTVSKTLTLTVKAVKPSITTSATLTDGALNRAYSVTLKATGTPTITWTKTSGTLPTGLKLSKAGKISGTPQESGTFKFKVKASNSAGSASRTFSLTITKPTFSGTFKDGTLKKTYSSTVKVTGGTASYTWKNLSDTLPNGLKLKFSGAKATLSGTPTKTGTFKIKLKVTDKNKASVTKTFTVKITKASASSSNEDLNEQKNLPAGTQNALPGLLGGNDVDVNLYAELRVVSEDIVEAYDGKDSDMVKVKAGTPLHFVVSNWGTEVEDVNVYVDDKPATDVEVSDEGEFTLPAEKVHDDFKVGVKAQSATGERESEELFIIAE